MIHPREIEILNILAGSHEPMISVDIIVAAGGVLSQSTVMAVLRKLLSLGYIEVEDIVYSGRVLSRAYRVTEVGKNAVLDWCVANYQSVGNIVTKEEIIERLK